MQLIRIDRTTHELRPEYTDHEIVGVEIFDGVEHFVYLDHGIRLALPVDENGIEIIG